MDDEPQYNPRQRQWWGAIERVCGRTVRVIQPEQQSAPMEFKPHKIPARSAAEWRLLRLAAAARRREREANNG